MAHTGFEAASSFRRFLGGELEQTDLRVELWRIPRASIPDHDRDIWLFDLWREVDRKVAQLERAE